MLFGISAENPKMSMCFLDFFGTSKKTHAILDFQQESKKMEIQNFQKFFARPIVLELLDVLDFLDFLKFWSVVTTKSPLLNKLLIKSLYRIRSGHVFRIRDLIDFLVFV